VTLLRVTYHRVTYHVSLTLFRLLRLKTERELVIKYTVRYECNDITMMIVTIL